MSLFGTSPDDPVAPVATSKSRLSLFDDEPSPAPAAKSSLFADDDNGPGWGVPTPKKKSREDVVKSLLPAGDVPDSYIDIFDSVVNGEDGSGGRISPRGVSKVLSAAKLGADDQTKIMNILSPGGGSSSLGRNEFNVLLALIGLAQEHEDITLDSVDERRRALPIPNLPTVLNSTPAALPGISELASKPPQQPHTPSRSENTSPKKPQTTQKQSMDDDPWGSPDAHKSHAHTSLPKSNSDSRSDLNGTHAPVRTTSNFTTGSLEDSTNGTSGQTPAETSGSTDSLWNTYGAEQGGDFSTPVDSGLDGLGFGSGGPGGDGQGPDQPSATSRAFGGGRVTTGGVEENISITLLPDKEGMFMFQHHNYQVSSSRRGSKVVRRYSDFVWLLDCLHKRFPFRQLPLLPPKRVGVNGNHLATDKAFIEKRRRGLARFCNGLVRHPVLAQEQLVTMFLTVPTELSVWRKQATVSVEEEFKGRLLPPGLEDSLPPTLQELFDQSRSGIRRSADIYINLCNLLDRLSKRNEGLAADHSRLASSLQSLTDTTADTYATDNNLVPLLNEGLGATAKHLSNSQSLLQDEARAWDEGVLEDLKRQRDGLMSMREMFERRDRYDRDNIPQLERRIQSNESKLTTLRNKPEGFVKPAEIEKITESIIKDKESIVQQHARGVFVKECIRDELIFFQQTQYHVSRWNQDWAQERVKYSELQADNWKGLLEELEGMPISE